MTLTEPAQLIEQMTIGLQTTLGVDAVATWLLNPTSHRYILTSFASADGTNIPSEERESLLALQVRSGEALVGRVISEGTGGSLPSVEAYRAAFGMLGRRREGLFNRWRALLPETCSVLALPMAKNSKPMGVIEFFSTSDQLGDPEIEWLQLYLDQLAALVQLVRVQVDARHQRRRLAALDAVVTAISTSSDLPDLLNVALLVVMEIVGAASGAICLVSPGEQGIYLAANYALPPGEAMLLASSQANLLLEDVIYYGQPTLRPVLAPNAEAQEELIGRAAMPLLAGGTVVGVLVLYGPLSELTGALDWPALVSVGSQIGIAVANTRLYEESQRERHRLSTVIESIADGVAICNGAGELILANEAAAALLGLGSLSALTNDSQYYARTLQGELVEPSQLPLVRALAGEVFRDYRLVVRGSNDRNVVLSFSGAPLRGSSLAPNTNDEQRDGAVVVFRDITEQRRLDEAKDEFLAIAAHELRSPLAAIKGYSDLLLRRELKSGTESRDLRGQQILNQQVNILVLLVDNLLDISRIDAGRLMLQSEAVELVGLIESVLSQARTAAAHHTITLEAAGPVTIWGDSIRLRQIITNLVTNAVRYSPTNTHIWIRVSADSVNGYISVDDEGPGIPPAERERLFERYYRVPGIKRTGSSTEGLGLGLYLCREIVMLHSGRIWVDDAPSGGARFQVAIPLYRPAATSSPTQTSLELDETS
jgi:two-component system phosphate regulon sensor histidine kinase PhoR